LANGRKVLLYLGRIHPKKGLLQLIDGWAEALRRDPALARDWMLVVAGWDQGGFEARLRSRASELSLERDVHFAGPQFGPDRQAAYHRASAFILPSFSEGLPLVVLEAWANRLPVLMTDECCLPVGFSSEAALRIEPSADSIAGGLLALHTLSESDLSKMGERGRSLVEHSFTWSAAAGSMRKVYRWLLGEENRPDFVL
jgi:poly(glycerol-phosphate) alpha-glucosyltransferase